MSSFHQIKLMVWLFVSGFKIWFYRILSYSLDFILIKYGQFIQKYLRLEVQKYMKKILLISTLIMILSDLTGCASNIQLPNNCNQEQISACGDIESFVYVNDTLYRLSGDQQSYTEMKEEFDYIGKIESVSNGVPEQNFQANDSIVGDEVYQYDESIVVHTNDKYWLYTEYGKTEIN